MPVNWSVMWTDWMYFSYFLNISVALWLRTALAASWPSVCTRKEEGRPNDSPFLGWGQYWIYTAHTREGTRMYSGPKAMAVMSVYHIVFTLTANKQYTHVLQEQIPRRHTLLRTYISKYEHNHTLSYSWYFRHGTMYICMEYIWRNCSI